MTQEMREALARMRRELKNQVALGDMEGARIMRDAIKASKNLVAIRTEGELKNEQ